MKICVINTHSVLNSGDAGIFQAQIGFLRKYSPNCIISHTSRTPRIDRMVYGPMGIRQFDPILPAPSIFNNRLEKVSESVRNLVSIRSKWDLVRELKQCDLVVSSGGGYFYSNRPHFPGPMFFQNYLHVKIASLLKKPIIFFPQSFGPFYNRTAVRFLRDILQGTHVIKIFAREQTSFDLLGASLSPSIMEKVDICPDLAFFVEGTEPCMFSHAIEGLPGPRLAITVRYWRFPGATTRTEKKQRFSDYLTTMRDVCREFHHQFHGSIIIIPQVRGPGTDEDDRIVSRTFYELLRPKVPESHLTLVDIEDKTDPRQICSLLSRMDMIVATRFHSAIFALTAGVPAISIAYQPKSQGIMKHLDLEDYCLSIESINVDNVLSLITRILEQREDLSRNIRQQCLIARTLLESKLRNALAGYLPESPVW